MTFSNKNYYLPGNKHNCIYQYKTRTYTCTKSL